MGTRPSARVVAVSVLAVILVGCTGAPPDQESTDAPQPIASPTSVAAPERTSPSPEPYVPAVARVAPSCDNIMVDSFSEPIDVRELPAGADPETWGDPLLNRGVVCWDTPYYTRAFAWTPASRADWDELVATLTGPDSAWFTEEGNRGTYLTYKTAPEPADAEGYNQTYLFTGDAVIMAFTKAETDLIVGPPAA